MNLKFTKSKTQFSFRAVLMLLSIMGFISFGSTSFAQIVIGTATSTQRNPLMYWYGYGRDASIYTTAEMATTTTGGTITTLSWNSSIASTIVGPTVIYLKAVGSTTSISGTSTWADNIASATQVYSGTTANFVAGWNTIDIVDFPILPGQNLMVLVECNYGGSGNSAGQTGTAFYFSAGGTDCHAFWQKDSSPPTGTPSASTGAVNTDRPQITLGGLVTPSCTAPTATFTVVPNCTSNQFSVNVNISNMGSATSLALSDGTNTYPSATAVGSYIVGPFASGSTQTITLTHNGNPYCNLVSTPQSYSCPPVNDEAINAISLPVNTDLACAATLNGTTIAATASADAAPSCSATGINDDVWYKFTATSVTHQFKFTNVTTGTMAVALYTGTPGALAGTTDCNSGATVSFTDLVPNTQYYARLYTTSSSSTVTTNFTVCLGTASNMTYDSVTTTQSSTSAMLPGATGQQIVGVRVYTANGSNPLNATQFNFTTSGTITAGEITSAKLYYTGTSSSFASTTLFGTAVANPNGTFSFVGSQLLPPVVSGASTNYFWLVYDVNCSAVVGHTADAICNSVTVDAITKTPIVTDPTGSRAITALAVPAFTSPTAGSVVLGTVNLEVGRINITGSNCVTSVSEVKFNVGVSPSVDIAQARCYYTTTSSGVETTTPFGSAIVHPTGDMVFSGTQAVTPNSSNYFWLAYDVDCASTTTTVDSLYAIPVSITSSAGVTAVAPLAANKKKGIVSAVAYVATTTTNVAAGAVNLSIGRTNITGNACYNTVTQVKFNTASSVASDISQAKCYYTTSTTFSTSTPFGSTVVNPSGVITFTGSQSIAAGSSNYFWLAYDVSCTAVVADSLVAIPVSITADNNTALVATPSSNQKKGITAATVTAPSYTATTTTSVPAGSAALAMGRSSIFGSSCVNNATQVKFNTSSSPVADITFAKCYYTTTTTFSNAVPFGAAVSNPNGDITFTGSQALAPGTGNYFWLAYDVACGAVLADSLVAVPVSITANAITTAIATPSTNAKKGITAITVYNTIADGDWSSPAIWACGVPPTSLLNVSINNNVTVTTTGNLAASVTVSSGKSLTVSSGSLTMGPVGGGKELLTNNGALNVSGGTLNVNGSVFIASGSTFTQSGGDIIVDGNDGTSGGSATGDIFSIGNSTTSYSSTGVSLTGGRILIVDPSMGSSSSIYAFVAYLSSNANNITASTSHTLQFGDGISTTPAGGTNGFSTDFWYSIGGFKPGSYVINTGSGTNRFVTQQYRAIIGGNLSILSGELRFNQSGPYNVAGDITVASAGILTATVELALSNGNYTTSTTLTPAASTNVQTISGAGIFRNSTTASTANFASLTVNNTSVGGVTFANANSLLSGANTGTVSGTLIMTAGTVNVGANALVLGTSPSSTGTYSYTAGMIVGKFKRWLSALTGANAFDLGSAFGSKKAIINFTTAPTTGGSLTASFNTGNPGSNGLPLTEGSNTYTNASALGYWTISAGDGLAGGTYTATLTGAGFNDVSDYTKLAIGKRATSSDPWALVGVLVAPTGSNSNFVLSRTGMTGFSDFAILNTQVPLEIKLVSFTGYNTGTVNNLNWTTASERDASHFKIMRSENGKTFEAIGKVDATNKTSGSKYNFVDEKPLEGKNFYQLSMVDRDGHSLLSNVIELSSKVGSGIAVTVHPNPVSNLMQINIAGKVDGKATILILDIGGKVIKTITPTGTNVAVDMSNMPAGTYIVKYMDNSNAFVTKISKN